MTKVSVGKIKKTEHKILSLKQDESYPLIQIKSNVHIDFKSDRKKYKPMTEIFCGTVHGQ